MNNLANQIVKAAITLVAIAVALYLLWMARQPIIYVLISGVLALIGKPLVSLLIRLKWKRFKLGNNLAAAITLIAMIGVIGGVLAIFIPSLAHELSVLSEIDVQSLMLELEKSLTGVEEVLKKQNIEVDNLSDTIRNSVTNAFNVDNVAGTFQSLAGSLGNIIFAIFSIVFITFFFLRETNLLHKIIIALVPDKFEGQLEHILPRLKNTLSRYFSGLAMQISIITILISIGLSIMGFSNTIVIGFFAGLINVIPYIGPIIGMAFGLILGLSQGFAAGFVTDPGTLSLYIVAVFGIVQMVDNFALQPIIFSNSINAHPLEIFLVISIAGVLTGISGMIIAVPSYSVIRLLAHEFLPNVKFIQRLTQNLRSSAGSKTS